ncbi:hypothetical protein [Granulicella sp. S190]|uniref:dCTP deaminase domain-containing protein n=1 Tax=Granulicella sp. S190 TaxID=1747226 RepID=UPI00131BF3CE|nr:hypothetical protein [Granulicella sp. S190]
MPDQQEPLQQVFESISTAADFAADRLKYDDPFRKELDRKGLLLSDQIDWFCTRQMLIGEGYKRDNLRPASYTLTIGSLYVDSAGKIRQLSKEKDNSFYMEPNSIVYVSTEESLDLPFYIVARFNLRVKWVYKGILLGTGPQVEPGFRGKLSCPLFNLTDRAIKIKLGDAFATIDFERTSNLGSPEAWAKLGDGDSAWKIVHDSKKSLEEVDEIAFGDQKYLLFKQKQFPPLKLLPDHDIISSLVQLSDEVKRWRAIGLGLTLAFISLALTLLNFQNNLYRELRTTSQQVNQLALDLALTKEKLTGAKAEQNELASPVTVNPAGKSPKNAHPK